MELKSLVPILRMFSVEKAEEFYIGFLGFTLDWSHTFEVNFPVYMQLSRGSIIHLSEHHGDASPGAAVMVDMTGIDAFHAEITAKNYKFAKPGIEPTPWGARIVKVADPFGNRLTFSEAKKE